MDLSKNPSQNLYSNELKTDSFTNLVTHNVIEENIRTQVNQFNTLGGLCDRRIVTNESDKNVLMSAKESTVPEKTVLEMLPENLVAPQKAKLGGVDEVESVEKIAEMVDLSTKRAEDNSPKLKKRLKVLMSRSHSVNVFNNSDDNFASNSFVDSNNSPLHVKDSVVENYKTKALNDQPNKKRKTIAESPNTKSNEVSEETNLKKSPFEEIEYKLEEMFAGIDDEQLATSTDEKIIWKKFNEPLDKSIKAKSVVSSQENDKECSIESLKEYNSCTPTKSVDSSIKTAEKCEKTKDYKSPPVSKSMAYMKHMTPQRRLSIGMRKELLKFSDDEIYKSKAADNGNADKDISKREKQNLNSKQVKKNISADKNIKQTKSCKYKKDINFHASSKTHPNSKKIIRKCETAVKTKQNRQKTKESRTQRLQSSENDAEEKQLQQRDIESKNRSPFILVKNNGNISVINTVTPDDLNEKLTRSKKPYNYAYERKTVKGCYSSTLGNRYDADTADSSWKCVFCKLGPHKKRLGDLFGPYVISSDCDEYRSIKDSLQRLQGNDSQFLNFPNTLHAFNNVTSNSHIKSTVESNCDNFISNQTVGMTQVSANCYEIWFHEDCAIWAPNIFVVGSRLAGLEEATWKSTRYDCVYCLKQGALLCCIQRGCKTTAHVPCARENKWLLDESKFWTYCNKHTSNKVFKKN